MNKNTNRGVVNLNEAMLSSKNKSRPSVSGKTTVSNKAKKTNTPRVTNNSSKTSTKQKSQRPSIGSRHSNSAGQNQKVKSKQNVKSINTLRGAKSNNGFIHRDNNGKILITRRALMYGAVGAAALVGAGSGIKFIGDRIIKKNDIDDTLVVPKSNVITSDALTEDENQYMSISKTISLPYGTLAWANNSDIITCLVPTDSPKPLANIEWINSKTGERQIVFEEPVGLKKGFEIYDARSNSSGMIWTEINILEGEWRIYAAQNHHGEISNPVMLDVGKGDWETPTIAIADNYAYWQVLPNAEGSKNKLSSCLKKCSFSSLKECGDNTTQNCYTNLDIENNPYTVYISPGRMSSPVYAYNNGVVITPRLKGINVIHQLTYLDFNDKVSDSISLPQNMKPLEAGYGANGFNFSFDAIYNYGEGISNLGTYTPLKDSKNKYENSHWLNFTRVPSAAPAYCDDYFIVRSTMAICAVDLKRETYCVLDRPNASDDYGDYLASSGNCSQIVTYANIYDQPVAGEDKKYCSLRIWEKS